MKQRKATPASLTVSSFMRAASLTVAILAAHTGAAFALDEGIDDLKAELAASSAGKNSGVEQFAVSDTDLQAQEAEILKKLGQSSESAPANAVSASRSEFESPAPKPEVISLRGNTQLHHDDSQDFITTDREPVAPPPPPPSNTKELTALKKSNTDLKGKLSQSQEKLEASQKELKEARDRLMMAEAEVERLSQLLEKRGNTGLDRVRGSAPVVASAAAAAAPRPAQPAVQVKTQEDLPIATVIVDKANLRTGPGTENSALMSVSKGTRLVIETRNGSWYRVFAPNGTRAWITGDVLSFSGPETAGSTLRVRAVDASLEKETNRIFGRTVN